ncbi:hypothetical protein [Azospira sp.]|uniref:hypothetical protein n=1 Tax=Azospira sp. TaxID=1872671 RepID=UPI00256B6FCA|nr:hypothetical protein [Azospira sp.]MDK9690541.1 hypothetical protein [Azospira sp.]
MNREIVEVITRELAVIHSGKPEVVAIQNHHLEVVEVASGNMAASDAAWQAGQFSPGDGSTTFRIPDLRGEFLRGLDDGRGVDTGRAIGSDQEDDFKTHSHAQYASAVFISGGGVGAARGMYGGATVQNPGTLSTGGTETRPRNVAMLACIKY